MDQRWKDSVDNSLREGAAKFGELAEGQKALSSKLDENTQATKEIKAKMDEHVDAYTDFVKRVQPAIDAVESMQAGVRVLGKIGSAVGWVGQNIRRIVVWVAPFVAIVAALRHWEGPKK